MCDLRCSNCYSYRLMCFRSKRPDACSVEFEGQITPISDFIDTSSDLLEFYICGDCHFPIIYWVPLIERARAFTSSYPDLEYVTAEVEEFDRQLGLYRDPRNNFIVKKIKDGMVVVIGCYKHGEVLPLTPGEVMIAKDIGYIAVNK